jgi:hypothetical protein
VFAEVAGRSRAQPTGAQPRSPGGRERSGRERNRGRREVVAFATGKSLNPNIRFKSMCKIFVLNLNIRFKSIDVCVKYSF